MMKVIVRTVVATTVFFPKDTDTLRMREESLKMPLFLEVLLFCSMIDQ